MNLYESIKKNLKEHEKLNEYSGEKFNNVELTYHCNECGNSWEEDCKLSQGSCSDIKKEINDGGSFDWYNADVPGGHCYNCGSEDTRIVDIDILNELDESAKKNLKESYSIEEVKDLLEELIGECRDYPENSPGYIYHSAINYLKDAGQDKLAIYLETCYDRCETSYIKNSSVIDDLRYALSKLGSIKESVKVGPIYRLGTEDYITSYNDIRLDEIGITLKDIELFKRIDTSESAPDKVNYLLYISMEWDGDKTISVPISYNISDNEYEQEINPPMLGIYDEDLDSEVYDTVDEVVRNLALKISHSGRMNEFDSFNATPEEIDDYYSNEYYNKTQEETDPEKKFKSACYTAASQWMSGVTEETSKEFIEDMLLPIAKRAYNSPNHSDEDYLNEIIFNLENERGIRFDFNK